MMDAIKPLNQYTARELEALQLSLAIAFQVNTNVNGKDAESNTLIRVWSGRVTRALQEVKTDVSINHKE